MFLSIRRKNEIYSVQVMDELPANIGWGELGKSIFNADCNISQIYS